MSTDRELLEMAARAAGIEMSGTLYSDGTWEPGISHSFKPAGGIGAGIDVTSWNPLRDDGDALRLAVKRYYTVKIARHEIEVWSEDDECLVSNSMQEHEDYEAATRRSIVEAAAEEGRRMP